MQNMIIDCIADLHGHYPKLEGGDLLIVAGDLTAMDKFIEYMDWHKWVCRQDYKKVIWIAGNHDNLVEKGEFDPLPEWVMNENRIRSNAVEYLCDSGTTFEYEKTIEGHQTTKELKIWGSPWTLAFPGINPLCTAFTGTEEELEAKFQLIPDDVDILITHSPPYGILDFVVKYGPFSHERVQCVGSTSLLKRVFDIRPRVHIFGHIHESYGQYDHVQRKGASEKLGITEIKFINCSHVNESYEPVNKPIRIVL